MADDARPQALHFPFEAAGTELLVQLDAIDAIVIARDPDDEHSCELKVFAAGQAGDGEVPSRSISIPGDIGCHRQLIADLKGVFPVNCTNDRGHVFVAAAEVAAISRERGHACIVFRGGRRILVGLGIDKAKILLDALRGTAPFKPIRRFG